MHNRCAVAALLVLAACSFAVPAQAGKFVSGTALVIVCPTVITSPGVYILGNDFTGTVTIDADNVTLDLNNKKISDAGISVVSTGHTDVTIRNGILENATENHILATSCTNVVVQNVDFVGSQTAIKLDDCQSALVNNCTIREVTSHGVLVLSSTGITIDGCEIFNSTLQSGIECSFSLNCSLNNVAINNNQINSTQPSAQAIFINVSDNIALRGCQVHNNVGSASADYRGFESLTSHDLSFFSCSFYENAVPGATVAGFFDTGGSNVAYDCCTTQTNSAFVVLGFSTAQSGSDPGSQSVRYDRCSCTGNVASGVRCFFIDTSSGVLLSGCVASRNVASSDVRGVNTLDSVACVLTGCVVEANESLVDAATGFAIIDTYTTLIIDCVAQKNTSAGDVIGFFLSNCTECTLRNNIAVGNQSTGGGVSEGFSINSSGIGFLNNTIFSNQAQDHGAEANNFVVPTGTIPKVIFTQSTGTFSATPTAYDNISVITS